MSLAFSKVNLDTKCATPIKFETCDVATIFHKIDVRNFFRLEIALERLRSDAHFPRLSNLA